MKNRDKFIAVLETMFWSFGSEPPPEVIWAANELLEWVEDEFGLTLELRFTEDVDTMADVFEQVIEELKKKLVGGSK